MYWKKISMSVPGYVKTEHLSLVWHKARIIREIERMAHLFGFHGTNSQQKSLLIDTMITNSNKGSGPLEMTLEKNNFCTWDV